MHDLGPGLEIMRRSGMDDGALFHQEDTLAELQRRLHILLDQQDGNPALID